MAEEKPAKKATAKKAAPKAEAKTEVKAEPAKAVKAEPAKADVEAPFGPDSHAPLDDGEQPEGFPIKGNADSMLYHVPGTSFYNRTVAEVWFRSAEAAEEAGFALPPSQRRALEAQQADSESAAEEDDS